MVSVTGMDDEVRVCGKCHRTYYQTCRININGEEELCVACHANDTQTEHEYELPGMSSEGVGTSAEQGQQLLIRSPKLCQDPVVKKIQLLKRRGKTLCR